MRRLFFLWFQCNKPNEMFWHNGNYDWTAKKIFGPFYLLIKLEYKDD